MQRGQRRRILAVVALSAICGLGLPTKVAAERHPKPAKLSLRDLSGKRVRLRDFRGHIVVLNFWATWCGPCNAEIPLLVKANREYEPRGVVFLGASLDDAKTRGNIPAFVDKHQLRYPVLIGGTANDLARLKLGIAIPATAVLDANGVIRFRILGQMRPGEMGARLDWLLRGSSEPSSGTRQAAPPATVTHLNAK